MLVNLLVAHVMKICLFAFNKPLKIKPGQEDVLVVLADHAGSKTVDKSWVLLV